MRVSTLTSPPTRAPYDPGEVTTCAPSVAYGLGARLCATPPKETCQCAAWASIPRGEQRVRSERVASGRGPLRRCGVCLWRSCTSGVECMAQLAVGTLRLPRAVRQKGHARGCARCGAEPTLNCAFAPCAGSGCEWMQGRRSPRCAGPRAVRAVRLSGCCMCLCGGHVRRRVGHGSAARLRVGGMA